jgi:hypothetical protein
MPRIKKNKVKLIYKGALKDLDPVTVYQQSFAKLTAEERLKAGWQMVKDVWKLKNRNPDELRFNRTVVLIKRI